MATELNADGLAIQYGPKVKGGPNVASPEVDGVVKEVVLDLDFENLNLSAPNTVMGVPLADLAARSDIMPIPAGSSLVSMHVVTQTPFVGGTFVAQLVTAAGTPVAGTASLASGAAAGAADVPGVAGLELLADAYLDAKPSAPLTAGTARVHLRYV